MVTTVFENGDNSSIQTTQVQDSSSANSVTNQSRDGVLIGQGNRQAIDNTSVTINVTTHNHFHCGHCAAVANAVRKGGDEDDADDEDDAGDDDDDEDDASDDDNTSDGNAPAPAFTPQFRKMIETMKKEALMITDRRYRHPVIKDSDINVTGKPAKGSARRFRGIKSGRRTIEID